ncbi:hypothetical protein BGX24_003869 [Mortierella sp. AD032]|nr:hypothetical protein BGX24_003869 [Mortierella sp. AD032]
MIQVTNAIGQKQLYRPEELTILLVSKIKELTEAQPGSVFAYTVITMPSDYNADQTSVLQEAFHAITEPKLDEAADLCFLHGFALIIFFIVSLVSSGLES